VRTFASSAAAEPVLAAAPARVAAPKPAPIDVARYVQENYIPYEGDASFLAGPTANTRALQAQVEDLCHLELEKGGVLDVDPNTPSTITSFGPGYIEK